MKALVAANEPPQVFVWGGALARMRPHDGGRLTLEPLNDAALRGVLARVADWFIIRSLKSGDEEEAPPPLEVVKDLNNLPEWPGIPTIEGIIECPAFAAGGAMLDTPGWNAAARLWYQPAPGLAVPPVPERPTPEDVANARELLLTDLLGDFPFTDQASKANALAALLLPFVRPLIDGPTPLHLIHAPEVGTGKGLLIEVIAVMATGRAAKPMAESRDEDEWRKRITAALIEGGPLIFFDNLHRDLNSAALAAVLTARTWVDRLLGFSKTVALPVRCVWLAAGNNVKMSREIIRRTVGVRLDARTDTPWERADFRHSDLPAWVRQDRGRLIAAALTLVRAWVAAGRPSGTKTLGSYEEWAKSMGGILDVAGVPDLLDNAQEFREVAADDADEWDAFVAAWWQEHQERPVGVNVLIGLAVRNQLLDSILGDDGDRSQCVRLGKALGKMTDSCFGQNRLERSGKDHSARQLYRLRQVPTAPPVAEPAPAVPPAPPPTVPARKPRAAAKRTRSRRRKGRVPR
jgi:hypothetical protein